MARIFSDLLGTLKNTFRINKATLDASALTVPRAQVLPDKAGTFAMIADTGERNTVTAVASVAGVVTLDWALGNYFYLELTEDVTSWVVDNVPAPSLGFSFMVWIVQDSTPRTVAKPGLMPSGGDFATLPVSAGSGAVDLLGISSPDGGTTLYHNLGNAYA